MYFKGCSSETPGIDTSLSFLVLVTGCRNPGTPTNGTKTGNVCRIGKNVTFSCDSGYTLDGASNITCENSGNWSDPTPTCQGNVILVK